MLRFMDSFDHYTAAADIVRKANAVGGSGAVTISPSAGRFGGGCLKLDQSGWIQYVFDSQPTWIVGLALQPAAFPATSALLLSLIDGSNGVQVDVRVNPDGTLTVTRDGGAVTGGTTSKPLRVGGWNFVEFKVTIADSVGSNTCRVRLNEEVIATVSAGQDLQATVNASANTLRLYGFANNTLVDDLHVADGTGSANNDFLGDCRVVYLPPNGAGASTQFAVNGASNNWDAVNDAAPDDDSTYVESSTVGHLDLYTIANLAVAGTIKGVQTVADARKTDAGARQLASVVRVGSTNYAGASKNLSASFQFLTEVRETDPATGVAWLTAAINAPLQVGVSLVA